MTYCCHFVSVFSFIFIICFGAFMMKYYLCTQTHTEIFAFAERKGETKHIGKAYSTLYLRLTELRNFYYSRSDEAMIDALDKYLFNRLQLSFEGFRAKCYTYQRGFRHCLSSGIGNAKAK